jgi:uncharacterized protein (DUF1330 family)
VILEAALSISRRSSGVGSDDWKPKRIVVTEFPSIEQARRWYDSEEYRALKALRLRTARGSVVLVEGV